MPDFSSPEFVRVQERNALLGEAPQQIRERVFCDKCKAKIIDDHCKCLRVAVSSTRINLIRAITAYNEVSVHYALDPAEINSAARSAHRAKLVALQRDMLRAIDSLPI